MLVESNFFSFVSIYVTSKVDIKKGLGAIKVLDS